jgi:predicted nucleotidyltransferase component of viral defense system
MIDRREIIDIASAQSLLPHIVEKDYVLGWILAGIYQHDALKDAWIFKGGTCLKNASLKLTGFQKISILRSQTPPI